MDHNNLRSQFIDYFWHGGEGVKTRNSTEQLIKILNAHSIDRKGLLVVVGGGALMDMVGMDFIMLKLQFQMVWKKSSS